MNEKSKLDSGYKVQDPVTYAKHSATKNKYFGDVNLEVGYNQTQQVISDLEYEVFYWKTRCLLAEKCLEENPGDPDIYPEQIQAHREYDNFLDTYSQLIK